MHREPPPVATSETDHQLPHNKATYDGGWFVIRTDGPLELMEQIIR